MRQTLIALAVFAAFSCLSRVAAAVPMPSFIPPTISGNTVSIPGQGDFLLRPGESEFEYDPDNGKYKLKNAYVLSPGGTADIKIEELEFDPDPTVTVTTVYTNPTAATQSYAFATLTPTSPLGAPTQISGTLSISVIDLGNDGASLSTVGASPLYAGQIDGVTVATLLDAPYSLVASAGGSASNTASFGPQASAVAVNSNIGILLTFSLSAGDTATFVGRFDVVPEPGTALTGALLMGGLLTRRRRR